MNCWNLLKYEGYAYYCLQDLEITAADLAAAFGAGDYSADIANAIYDNYYYKWVGRISGNPDAGELEKARKIIIHKILNRYNLTQERYTTLLNSYKNSKNNLIGRLKSESINRYNDTPQGGGDWSPESDDHLTNVTKVNTESDFEPVMAKLARIQRDYENVMKNWVKEFEKLFGGEIYD